MFSTSRIAGFSDHKYLCKESININQNQNQSIIIKLTYHRDYLFSKGVVSCTSCPLRLKNSLVFALLKSQKI